MARLGFNPENLPIDRIAGGPVVPKERLTVDSVRQHFLKPPSWTPEVREEPVFINRPSWILAAVMVPLVLREEGLSLLLTQRALHLQDHPGQISFPGGRVDETDNSVSETALREMYEEVGIESHHVEIIGRLPEYKTGSGFRVMPVVSFVKPQFNIKINPEEVAQAFEIPLSHFMNGNNYEVRSAEFPNRAGKRSFFTIPYEDRFVWGATAGMLRNFYHFLRTENI